MLWEDDWEAASLSPEASDILSNHTKMVVLKSYGDPSSYVSYYRVQVCNGLPGFQGIPVMCGVDWRYIL